MKPTLTVADITDAYNDPDWEGHGYLGAIAGSAAFTDRISRGNRALIERANELGWDRATLWSFLNSKSGRWYGEAIAGLSEDPLTQYAQAARITRDGRYR